MSSHIEALRRFVEAQGFAGYDPYDALTSPLVCALTLGLPAGRMAWTQFFRRCPANLRPLFGVPKRLNAKGVGLFLEGYSKLYGAGTKAGRQKSEGGGRTPESEGQEKDSQAAADAGQPRASKLGHAEDRSNTELECKELRAITDYLVGKLEELRSPNCSGAGWGYPFDWQSRAAFVPAGTPTLVNTSFIGHALLDCHECTGNTRALKLALTIPPFFLNDLNRATEPDGFCFSYTPLDRNFVHNANMLGAALLLRLGRQAGNAEWLATARQSMAYSVNRQRPDGSWPYAETDFQGWVDSFHTGFNLEALRWFVRLGEASPAWRAAYERGLKFYAERFFLADGTPKYYHDRIYPIDIHAPAEAVYFFSGEGQLYAELTDRVLTWMLTHLRDEREGYFYFRKTRLGTNRIPYMRWSQAWAMRALAEYQFHRGE